MSVFTMPTHKSTYGLQPTTPHNRTQHPASLIGTGIGYTNMNSSTDETGGHRYAVHTAGAIARRRSMGYPWDEHGLHVGCP